MIMTQCKRTTKIGMLRLTGERTRGLSPTLKELKNAKIGRNSLWGRAHQLVTHEQMASPENIHTSNIIWPV